MRRNGRAGFSPPASGNQWPVGAVGCSNWTTQQRLSRERWNELLDWMVAKQGMAELAADDRAVVLDYLATYYGQDVPRP
jgi:hypothetical protein